MNPIDSRSGRERRLPTLDVRDEELDVAETEESIRSVESDGHACLLESLSSAIGVVLANGESHGDGSRNGRTWTKTPASAQLRRCSALSAEWLAPRVTIGENVHSVGELGVIATRLGILSRRWRELERVLRRKFSAFSFPSAFLAS